MPIISLSQLEIENRQRSDLDAKHIQELKESILARGLLHAPVVRHLDNNRFALVAGGCRIEAIKALWTEGRVLFHDRRSFIDDELPCVVADLHNASEWMAAEYEENAIRAELPWQDRVRAIAAIHSQRLLENPQQSYSDTAREMKESGISGNTPTALSVDSLRNDVKEAAVLVQHMDKYQIKTARNANEAFAILMQTEEKKWQAELVRRQLLTSPEKEIEVRHGDLTLILPALDGDRFDLLLADPPYGIGADSGGYKTRAIQHHLYDDSHDTSRIILQTILTEGFRICKSRANLFIFTDIQHFDWLASRSAAAGWVPWRTPIIWQKSRSEGLAPWGRSGFRRVYELIFFATKGQRGLIFSPVDVLEARRVSKADRRHGAEKPVDLLRQLIEAATMTGDSVLDPCCGVGSTLQAMRQTKRRGLGIEINQDYYNVALTRANTDDEPDDTSSETAA